MSQFWSLDSDQRIQWPQDRATDRNALPLTRELRPLDLHQADPVRAALVNQEITLLGHPHVPDDPVPGRNRPALELLGHRVEAHQHVWAHSGLVVPDDVVHDREGVGM